MPSNVTTALGAARPRAEAVAEAAGRELSVAAAAARARVKAAGSGLVPAHAARKPAKRTACIAEFNPPVANEISRRLGLRVISVLRRCVNATP
jgi:hypothetical protein